MSHKRISIGERCGLFADGLYHALIAMPDVYAHQLAVEIDEPLPLRRPEINSFRSRHGNGIDLRLRRPFKQGVLLGKVNDLLPSHARYCRCRSHDVL